jgi:antitoxin Phd
MSKWQLQQAKARFSEFLDTALKRGPQIFTPRGVEEVVLVPMEEWRRLQMDDYEQTSRIAGTPCD